MLILLIVHFGKPEVDNLDLGYVVRIYQDIVVRDVAVINTHFVNESQSSDTAVKYLKRVELVLFKFLLEGVLRLRV